MSISPHHPLFTRPSSSLLLPVRSPQIILSIANAITLACLGRWRDHRIWVRVQDPCISLRLCISQHLTRAAVALCLCLQISRRRTGEQSEVELVEAELYKLK